MAKIANLETRYRPQHHIPYRQLTRSPIGGGDPKMVRTAMKLSGKTRVCGMSGTVPKTTTSSPTRASLASSDNSAVVCLFVKRRYYGVKTQVGVLLKIPKEHTVLHCARHDMHSIIFRIALRLSNLTNRLLMCWRPWLLRRDAWYDPPSLPFV